MQTVIPSGHPFSRFGGVIAYALNLYVEGCVFDSRPGKLSDVKTGLRF